MGGMVAEVGLEPTRSCLRQILSLLWLPISPLGHLLDCTARRWADALSERAPIAQPASGAGRQSEMGAGRNRAGFCLPLDERAKRKGRKFTASPIWFY